MRWNCLVPNKLNILLWRIRPDKISTLLNLRDNAIDYDFVLCPVCNSIGESSIHSVVYYLPEFFLVMASNCCLVVIIDIFFHNFYFILWADYSSLSTVNDSYFDAVVIVPLGLFGI